MWLKNKKERLKRKAMDIIINRPELIRKSLGHKPGHSYVEVGRRCRVYFCQKDDKIILDSGMYIEPLFWRIKMFFRGF